MEARLGWTMVATLAMGLVFGAATPGRAGHEVLDDDLAVVKKAVRTEVPEETRGAASAEGAPTRSRASRAPGQWLKVRIVEGSGKRSRITVNLPLSVARALGGDLPIELGDQKLRVSDVLRTLEAGEPLVEVKKKDSTVRVWIE